MRWVWYIHTLKSTHKIGNQQKLLKITLNTGHTVATCSIVSVCKNVQQNSSTWTQSLDCFHVCQHYYHLCPGMNETHKHIYELCWAVTPESELPQPVCGWMWATEALWLKETLYTLGFFLFSFSGFYIAGCCECKISWNLLIERNLGESLTCSSWCLFYR